MLFKTQWTQKGQFVQIKPITELFWTKEQRCHFRKSGNHTTAIPDNRTFLPRISYTTERITAPLQLSCLHPTRIYGAVALPWGGNTCTSQGEGQETWDSPVPSHMHTHGHTHTEHSILPRRVRATVWHNLFCNMTGHSLLTVTLRSWKDPQWQCASHDRVLEPISS